MATRVQSVERAAAILQVLAVEDAPTSLGQLAAALGLAKATTHGLVQTLRDVGFVDQDAESGGYLIGAGLLELGSRNVDLNEVAAQILAERAAAAGETNGPAQPRPVRVPEVKFTPF